jgi:hypothetical protein
LHILQRQAGDVTELLERVGSKLVLGAGVATISLVLSACTSQGPSSRGGAAGEMPAGTGTGGALGQAGNESGAPPASGGAGVIDGGSAGRNGTAGGEAGGAGQAPDQSAWPMVDDYGGVGAFETTRDEDIGPDQSFDVFRPAVLGEGGRRHPIITWANGTLFSLDEYQALLTHWASHGFVVVASHSNSTAGGVTHQAGIDWLVGQNGTPQSIYFEVLDPSRVGVAGHSQGGGATIAAGAGEPAPSGVITTLPLMPIPNFEADLSILGRQLVPMFCIVATEEDRDPAFAGRLFQEMNAELVQAAFIGVHEDAMNAAMAAPTLAWFRYRLMADTTAEGYFYPSETCLLCRDPAWESVKHKP